LTTTTQVRFGLPSALRLLFGMQDFKTAARLQQKRRCPPLGRCSAGRCVALTGCDGTLAHVARTTQEHARRLCPERHSLPVIALHAGLLCAGANAARATHAALGHPGGRP
jgi:hypothetical protein